MKKLGKKLIAGTAFAAAAAFTAGCEAPEPPVAVYGPPPIESESYSEEKTTNEVQSETYIAPETFKPETEIPEDLYGPPEFFEEENES